MGPGTDGALARREAVPSPPCPALAAQVQEDSKPKRCPGAMPAQQPACEVTVPTNYGSASQTWHQAMAAGCGCLTQDG